MPAPRPNDLSNVAVIIPALNEAEALGHLLPALQRFTLGQVIVCDNGSTDETRDVAKTHGATWVYEPKRGYGAACHAGIEHLAKFTGRVGLATGKACLPIDTVVFIDADQTREIELLPALVDPIARGEADFVIGARIPGLREVGSATWPQRFGNWLMPNLIKWGWGHRYTDLGPFRAIRWEPLEAMGMRDRAYGWTIEMQIRAVELGLRTLEIPIPHRKREHGHDKISGTIRGTALAGYWIVKTCASMWLTKRGRMQGVKSEE